MNGTSKCKICEKEFKWYTDKTRKPQKFCSKECYNKEPRIYLSERYRKIREDKDLLFTRFKKRFEKTVVKKEGCWDWKGCQHHSGYVPFKEIHRKNGLAHRASWIIYRGEIPEGMLVCHTCDNKRCTNPDHLFLGSHKENTQDMHSKGRGNIGKKNNKTVLTEEQVIEIRNLLKIGVKMTRIAKDYSVNPGTIWFISKNITWKHLK